MKKIILILGFVLFTQLISPKAEAASLTKLSETRVAIPIIKTKVKPTVLKLPPAVIPVPLPPAPIPPPKPAPKAVKKPAPAPKPASKPARKVIPGNTYTRGQCTWYAKSRRPDLPNNLGNANTWYARAAAQGFAVGSRAQAGAIGMARGYMHVVYIERVNANGTVNITEMNYRGNGGGPFKVSPRVAKASEFVYIY